MYVCLCNPFTDRDLDSAIKDNSVEKKTAAVYQACSGGEKPNCGNCLCEIQDRIETHNAEALLLAAE